MSVQPETVKWPGWVAELLTLRTTTSLFVLSGNVRDLYLNPRGLLRGLPNLLAEALAARGVTDVVAVRPGGETHKPEEIWRDAAAAMPTAGPFPQVALRAMPDLVRQLHAVPGRVLIVLDASRAIVRPGELTQQESDMFRAISRAIDDLPRPDSGTLIWVVDAPHDVPSWFVGGNPTARTISVPLPTVGDRIQVASVRLGGVQPLPERDPQVQYLAGHTSGLPLRALVQITQLNNARSESERSIEESVRVHRVGVLDNPWREPALAARLHAEIDDGPDGVLRSQVRGQEPAIAKSLDVLIRSVTGLRSAQGGSRSGRPRGVLFFAGPTGVGKTELAKRLTELLFGDDGAMIRFDMSEFAAEHSVERLVGAPPGFVGFSQGGELTNAVRERPFSLLLFDEIEKADPLLLDRFLQILDDGRLTDGRGETTYFTESVIVFTSNLGVYDPVTHPVTGAITGRVLAVDPTAPYPEVAATIAGKVREHFTSIVGRPELLNRIGDNVVVFDFIRPPIDREILELMVANVVRSYRRELGAELELEPAAWDTLAAACLTEDNLLMGGRGISNLLETVLIDPLARWTFAQGVVPARVRVAGISRDGSRYSLQVR